MRLQTTKYYYILLYYYIIYLFIYLQGIQKSRHNAHNSRERLFIVDTGQPHEVQGIPLGNTGLELEPATSTPRFLMSLTLSSLHLVIHRPILIQTSFSTQKQSIQLRINLKLRLATFDIKRRDRKLLLINTFQSLELDST